MAGKKNVLTQQCRILKEYVATGDCSDCVRLVESEGKLYWHVTSHGKVINCEEVEGVVIKSDNF